MKKIDKKLVAFILGGMIIGNSAMVSAKVDVNEIARNKVQIIEDAAYENLDEKCDSIPNNHSWFHIYNDIELKKSHNSVVAVIKECKENLLKIKNSPEFLKNCEETIEDIKFRLSEKFFFGRSQMYNDDKLRALAQELNRVILRCIELEELDVILLKENNEANKRKLVETQDKYFNEKKESLSKKVRGIMNEIDSCLASFSNPENFTGVVNSLMKEANQILETLKSVEISDDIRTDDIDEFMKNTDDKFGELNSKIDAWCKKASSVRDSLIAAEEQLKLQLLLESKEVLLDEIEDLKNEVNSGFVYTDALNDKEKSTVDGLKSKLLNSLEKIEGQVKNINDFNDKILAESSLNVFKNLKTKYFSQKNDIEKIANERRIRSEYLKIKIGDLSQKLSWLRSGKLKLSQVVGGYKNVINDLDGILAEHRDALNGKKGIKKPTVGIILSGVPGTGKTTTIQAWAAANNLEIISLNPNTSSDVVEQVQKAIANAKSNTTGGNSKVTVILIDEIDAFLPKRDGLKFNASVTKDTLAVMGEVNKLVEGESGCPGVILAGTTNQFENIDPAAVRPGRMGVHRNVTLPTTEEIADISKAYLDGYRFENHMSVDEFVNKFSADFYGETGAVIHEMLRNAVDNNAKRNNISIDNLGDVVLKVSDVMNAIKVYRDNKIK